MNETNCYTCLAFGRKLKPLKLRVGYIFTMLCPEICYKDYSQYLICWECEFMIDKIKRFQDRLTKATKTMKLYKKGKAVIFEQLSSLKMTEILTISILPQTTSTLPQNTSTLTHNTLRLPHNTSTLPHYTTSLPQNTLRLLHTTPTLPENTPIQSLKDMLAEPLKLDEQTVTVKLEEEDEEMSRAGDYDELIQPSMIQDHSSDPLAIPMQDEPEIKKKYKEIEVLPQQSIKNEIVASNVTNFKPQKIFINIPKEQVPLRGLKEPVKVTGSIPNLVTSKAVNPSTVQNEDSTPINEKDKLSVLNIDKLITKLLKTPLKNGEFITKLVSNEPDVSEQRNSSEDEAKCIILDLKALNAYIDRKRSNPLYVGSRFKCGKCVEWFQNQDNLDEHKKKHDESQGPAVCKICEQRFPDDSLCNEHYEQHFIIYGCIQCPFQHSNRLKVSDHFRQTHEESCFDCMKCQREFKTYKERRRHMRKEHDIQIKCEECGKLILRNHMASHKSRVHLIPPDQYGIVVECTICKKKVKKNSLKSHMTIHDDGRDNAAYCADCGTYYKSKHSYELHLKHSLKHNSIEQLGLKCEHCNKYFTSKQMIKNHVEEIIGVKYTCDICKKDLRNKRLLIRHIQVVHEGKKQKVRSNMCEICGKSFTGKKFLREHINSHYGRRTLVCKDCGATFIYSAALFTHRRLVHKVKRKYETMT